MIDSMKVLARRVFRFFAVVGWVILGALRWLGRTLFGEWQPPRWLRASGRGLVYGGKRAQARPRRAAAEVLAVAALLAAAFFGWQWYKKLPVPHTVQYSVFAPGLTDYRAQPIAIRGMQVRFRESVAPLSAIGKTVDSGVSLDPAMPGTWQWSDDRTLAFTPTQDWPIDKTYAVELDKKHLLNAGVLLKDYRAQFKTLPMSMTLSQSELYQDPTQPAIKAMLSTYQFTHPVDADSVRKRVAFTLGAGLSYADDKAANEPQVTFDKELLNAYVRSAPLATPLESTPIRLQLAAGIQARDGGNELATTQTSVTVAGRYQLTFTQAGVQFADNDRGQPEPVLMFDSSMPVADEALAGKVKVWLLPYKQYGYNSSEITEGLLAQSQLVPLTQVPSSEPLNSQHAFKLKAESGRDLYVQVPAMIEAVGGYLAKQNTISLIRMPKYPRTLRFLADGALLSLKGEKRVGFMARGVPGAHVEIARLLPNQLQHLVDAQGGSFAKPYFSEETFNRMVERQSLDIPLSGADAAQAQYDHVDLADYLAGNGGRRGIFVLKLSASDTPSERTFGDEYGNSAADLRFIVVTDLGIIAKRSTDGSHDIFVQSIDSGSPVQDAQVDIMGVNGLPVASAKTDHEGHVHFAKLEELRREKTPLMYVVSKGNDESFLPITRRSQNLDLSRFDIGGLTEASADAGHLSAYMFTDRGLYRPGETAHVQMIVRTQNWQGALQGLPVVLRIYDPRGLAVSQQAFNLSASGFETFDFASKEAAPAGDYTAELALGKQNEHTQLGSVTFKVRDFEPDRLKVNLSLHEQPVLGWIAAKDVDAQLTALQLFGAPAVHRRVAGKLTLSPIAVAFQKYSDYRFYTSDSLKDAAAEDLQETETDDAGHAKLDLNLARFANNTYNVQVSTQVFEAGGGRSVAANASILVSAANYLVGVKSKDSLSYIAKDVPREVQWLAVGPNLQPVAVEGLHTELVEHRYVSVLVKQANGTFKYESRRKSVSQPGVPLVLGATGATQALPTATPGDFTVQLKDANGNLLNEVNFLVAGASNTSRSLERNAELQLRLNKSNFANGEDIAINIRAPYTGAGLITVERDKVYSQQWFKTDSLNSVQHIKVPQGLEGNAYVNVQFVRDIGSAEVYMSPLSYGVAPFSIDLDARRLPLRVQTPDKVEPGEILPITLTSDKPSRAVVYAVDEGILQVARYSTPNPLAFFFQKRALQVSTSQILSLILPEFSQLLKNAAPGGDTEDLLAGHLNPFKRKHKPPVVFWSGLIDLPAGETRLDYQVPDSFNGKLHVFAVAVDDSRMGVTETTSDVRGPLVLTPNVPAFVAPGDEFIVTAGVFSNLPEPTKVHFELHTSAGLQVLNSAGSDLQLGLNQEGLGEFRLKALDALGSADLTFVAVLPNGKRIQIAETTSVRPANERSVALRLGRLNDTSLDLKPTRELFPQLRDVQVGVAASPLVWGRGLQNYLNDYGYVCTEQLVSKAMPGLIWGAAEQENAPATDAVFGTIADAAVQRVVSVLRSRQNQTGGFGLWGASPEPSTYASLYSADFLLEAKERGHEVPADLLQRLNAYLTNVANGPSEGLPELRGRAYAAYLLSRQGILVSGALADIRERYETYHQDTWRGDLGAAYLAASYKLLKQEQKANELFRKVPWLTLEATWVSDGLYYDPLVHDAEHLRLLAKHFPDQMGDVPPTLLDRLGVRMNEHRYNSLSAALLLRGLEAYDRNANTTTALKVSAWLDDKQAQPLVMSGLPPRSAVPVGTQKLSVTKTGDLPGFYMFSETGYDRGTVVTPIADGLEIVHEYLALDGKTPVSKVKVGDEFLVRLRLRAVDRQQIQQVAVVDLLPGGVEPVYNLPSAKETTETTTTTAGDSDADNSADSDADSDANSSNSAGRYESADAESDAWRPPVGEAELSDWRPEFVDVRDDRVVLYGTALHDVGTFIYRVRATNAGTFSTPPAYAEGMYEPTLRGRGVTGQLEIAKP